MSELFTGSTALKLVNALNKPPSKLSLSYQGLSKSYLYRISNPTMEEIGTTNPKYHRTPIVSLMVPINFVHPRLKNHPLGTSIAIQFTKQMVPSMCPVSFTRSLSQLVSPVFGKRPIKCFLPSIIFLRARHFFLLFLSFSSHTFSWAYVNFGSFSLFVHSLVCQITHSFLNRFQQTCTYQHFSHACSTCHAIFSLK